LNYEILEKNDCLSNCYYNFSKIFW